MLPSSMSAPTKSSTYLRVLYEANQDHSTRRDLYTKIEAQLGVDKKLVSFFTTFDWPVQLENRDADMLEEVLHNCCYGEKELVLIINCPGGDALAAERMVNVCRSFGKGGKFSVIVPKMAKSAATMVCLGADTIGMSRTSELGPIDPQIKVSDGIYYAAHEIVESYNDLMTKANKSKGNLEPYLQQLYRFDATQIRWIKSAQDLSKSIAISVLKTGVMKGKSDRQIAAKIEPFLLPEFTKVHGRPIYADVVQKCGLNVTMYEMDSPIWRDIWELYVRCNYMVSTYSTRTVKVVETATEHFHVPNPFAN
jgi:serine dehydrogenase proteinase